MSAHNIALTGVPRGGTTLACRILGHCEQTVALFEPMLVQQLAHPREAALTQVLRYYDDVRAQIAASGTAPSQTHLGEVPDNPFADPDTSGHRHSQASPGLLQVKHRAGDSYALVIKHNAAFTALLPELGQHLPTYAIIRNPLAVLASWQSVPLPVRGGRIPAGERLDITLHAKLNTAGSVRERQLIVLDWFFQRFAEHLPRDRIIPYESIIASQGDSLRAATGLHANTHTSLDERHPRRLCAAAVLKQLAADLHARPGAWQHWYDRDSIDRLLEDSEASTV